MPGEKFHDSPGEEVVAVTGDHMPGAADIDEVDLRKACNELVGSLLGDQIAHLAADKKHGHAVTQNCVNRRVEAIDFGHLDRRKRRGAIDELRIPMPVPPIIAAAQVCPEAVEVGRPGSVRVVLLDRVCDLVQ